jgi:hypothetical protein
MKKVSFSNLLPAAVIADGITEVNDVASIKKLLEGRTIISADRFNLKPGVYKFVSVRAAHWDIGKGKNAKTAVMCLITLKNEAGEESETTIGSLRKINSEMKNFGPSELPVNESDLLDMITDRGIEITKIHETTATVFADGAPKRDENGNVVTKPTKLMAWSFGPVAAAKPGKKN